MEMVELSSPSFKTVDMKDDLESSSRGSCKSNLYGNTGKCVNVTSNTLNKKQQCNKKNRQIKKVGMNRYTTEIQRRLPKENNSFFFGEVERDKEVNIVTKLENLSALLYSKPQSKNDCHKLSEEDSYITFKWKLINTHKQVAKGQKYLDEGLYLNRSNTRKYLTNLLVCRLLKAGESKWFNMYNELDFLENPLVQMCSRLNQVERPQINCKYSAQMDNYTDIIIVKESILQIYLTKLKFTHHPLFSPEHVLAEKLCYLYNQYLLYTRSNNIDRIKAQLEARRFLRKKLESQIVIDNRTLKKVNRDIKHTRKLYFDEGKKQRENLKCILSAWKQIKKIREKQKFSNTNIKLLIIKENVNYEADSLKFNKQLEETVQEIINEMKNDSIGKEKKFNVDISSTENLEDNSSETIDFDVDENAVRLKMHNLFQQCFRSPGEPILKLLLSNNNDNITIETEDEKEIMRRNAIKFTKIYINIICDEIIIWKSKPVNFNDNFLLEIEETFSIKLQNVPKYLKIEIIELHKGIKINKISDIMVIIPGQDTWFMNKPIRNTFDENKTVPYRHTDIRLKKILKGINSTELQNHNLVTAGYIEYCIGWEKTSLIKRDILGKENKLLKNICNKNLAINFNKLSEWMSHIEPDPQDPENVTFFECMADYDTQSYKKHNIFRLDTYAESFKYCQITDIEQNIRFKVLQKRNRNEIELAGIPNRIKEIPSHTLNDIQTRNEENQYFSPHDTGGETDILRNYNNGYLKQVYIKLFHICKNSENNLTYESVVDEKNLAHFEILLKTMVKKFLHWFYWHQPSKFLPINIRNSHEKKLIECHKLSKEYNVNIKIISGKNIPSRIKDMENKSQSDNDKAHGKMEYNENDVKPVVEVSYENISTRTNSSNGINPIWNETLIIPLKYQNIDYLNPDSLNGTITVNLYDECDSTLKYQNKKQYKWLGAVEIPLSALSDAISMSGSFKVKLGQLLLGYVTETERYLANSPKFNSTQYNSSHTYIEMELSIIPNIPKLIANMEELPSEDVPYIHKHIIRWNQLYNDNFPSRKFSALVIDTHAKSICITRYLKPLEPPQINLDGFDITADQCLRFVSLIPFTECNNFYQKVWLTTSELVHFKMGSIIDHVVALACYLLALKIDAWLLLGYGIPYGSTAYVLTRGYIKDSGTLTYSIYDVFYAEKYSLTHPDCPLKKIYCLANGENVWANTQRNDDVATTRFDLNRKSDWSPLFNNNISAPTNFINNKMFYNIELKTENLDHEIEMRIKKKISKLRQLERTVWNFHLTNLFKNVLKSFEINYMYNKNPYELIHELIEKMTSYKVTGYVLNLHHLNMSSIIKNIKRLGICEQENNEFVLSVYIHIYPGPIFSIWIFIGYVIN